MITASIADELLLQVPVNRDISWSPGCLGMDPLAFNAIAQRVLELETMGSIDVIELGRESDCGSARLTAIRFIRLCEPRHAGVMASSR